MANRVLYYATPSDLINVLKSVDNNMELSYYQYGNFKESEFQNAYRLTSLLEYPQIGYSHTGDYKQEMFMVLLRSQPLKIKNLDTVDGKRVILSVQENEPCIMWSLGGLWKENMIIMGQVATSKTDGQSQKLFSQIKRIFAKQFKRVGTYYIGPEIFLNKQYRLIRFSDAEAEEYDVHLP